MSTQNPFFNYCTTYPGGSPLKPGDTNSSTGVEFGGIGPAGAPFVITDSGSQVASGVFNSSGVFIQPLVNLAQGPHRFELRGNASLPATDVWLYTVDNVNSPTINSVIGIPSGAAIPPNTTTFETALIISGTSTAQKIEILNGGDSMGQAPVDPATGRWTLTIIQLKDASYRFIAKDLDSGGSFSAAWMLDVKTAPTIEGIYGSYYNVPGETLISDGGTFVGRYIRIVGKGVPHHRLTSPNSSSPDLVDKSGDWSTSRYYGRPSDEGRTTIVMTDTVNGLSSNGWTINWRQP